MVPAGRAARGTLTCAAAITLLLLAAATAPAQEGMPAPGSGRILIIMQPPGHDDDRSVLRHALVASLSAQTTDTASEVAVPLPAGAELDSFSLFEGAPHPPPNETRVEARGGMDWAVAAWHDGGPQSGDWVAMRLDAHQTLDRPRQASVHWQGLPENLTSVRIFLPTTHIPLVDAGYVPVRQDTAGALVGWNLTQPPSGNLEFTIRAIDPDADPALAAPPSRIGGFLVLAGIATVAAAVWFAGKKLDARLQRDD